MRTFIFLAPGFEEMEAIAPIDILRRVGVEVEIVSVVPARKVTGANGITIVADTLFKDADFSKGDMLILPGGMPGTENLKNHAGLKKLINIYNTKGKYISAICAAPIILGEMGLLVGKKATSYPGFEKQLLGAQVMETERVVVSDNIITAKGPGVALEFAIKIVETLKGVSKAKEIALGVIA